jgi:hypothetical protein
MANEVADHELYALALLRGKIPSLEIPLACIVDYYGVTYFCQALMPLTHGSLAYGSNTDGIFVFGHDEAHSYATQVA